MAEITGMSGPVTKIDVLGGVPGAAGVSVTTTELDADGHLLIGKSNGVTTDVGKVKFDVTPEVQAAWDGAVAAETEATTQAGIATTAASNAKSSEDKAAASAAAASGAAASEAAAKTSETNAALSASSAAGSATTATTKAGVASSAATAAATSASNAALSESAAATSESVASTAASNAATSESHAATSESHAVSSASAAAGSANAANSSATAASGSANAAALSASSASGSATAAGTSASQAAGSATAASSAATTAITTGLADGGSIKAADDATLSAAKAYADGQGILTIDKSVGLRVLARVGETIVTVYGDTGLRDITSLVTFPEGVSASYVRLSRVGRVCTLAIGGLKVSAPYTGDFLLGIPTGFLPSDSNIREYNGVVRLDVYSSGSAYLLAQTAFSAQSFLYMKWITRQSWPASLPGNAYGTIPIS